MKTLTIFIIATLITSSSAIFAKEVKTDCWKTRASQKKQKGKIKGNSSGKKISIVKKVKGDA